MVRQARLRLQAAGCRYRIKQVARSPYVQVYETLPPRRQQSARGYRADSEQDCWDLAALLLQADQRLLQGQAGLDWDCLAGGGVQGQAAVQTWGELRALVAGWIAPGGPKARDSNPFVCFRDGGYFGRAFAAAELAHREDPRQQLIRREYNSKGFYGVVQMVNYLAQRGVAIATPDLRQRLEQLKRGAGRLRAPAPRHIDRLPGEVEADAGVIEVGSFHSHGDGSATKPATALPCRCRWSG